VAGALIICQVPGKIMRQEQKGNSAGVLAKS
jgi:hypothetical protein